MMYKFIRMDTLLSSSANVHCGCVFCKGGKQRLDVEHYKIFSMSNPPTEYYLNIDLVNKVIAIEEKF